MNQFYQEKVERPWVVSDVSVLATMRAYTRMLAALAWTVLCYGAVRAAAVLFYFVRPVRRRACRKISRLWLRGMPPLIGMKIHVRGARPPKPFFLVVNHITWLDFIVMNLLCDGRCVAMAEMKETPILGPLTEALEPIFVYRVREDVPRVKDAIFDSIQRQHSILLAPEGTISPGRTVRRFRASLLEPAVRSGKAVHYASITYKTPEGCPRPSDVVLFGPDPHFRPDDDEVNNPELWGPQRSFLGHFLRLTSLPYYEAHVRFGDEPMVGEDRIALANGLHRAVNRIFSPLE
jgi:1-acyl-sn-glycerol-3-phosphate acyltransferase